MMHFINIDGLNCTWGNWTAFSPCSVTGCSEGTQYRERVCESLDPNFTGMWCSRRETEIEECNPCTGKDGRPSVNVGQNLESSFSTESAELGCLTTVKPAKRYT